MEGPDIYGPQRGVIPRVVENIFKFIEIAPESIEFSIRLSYVEIYMERIRDLLCDDSNNLQIHESKDRGVYIRHCTELYMQSPEDVLSVMKQGNVRRKTATTGMNDDSSRSHAVVLIELIQKDLERGGSKSGKLYMVDLAGSEKVSKTGAAGETLEEAKNINKSLSALGLVIMNLTEGNSRAHIPYRDSKLTRILQESLGGNARTTIIICCSPSSYNEQESLSSLYFGKRAKKIKNTAKINVEYSAQELTRQLEVAKAEIVRLVKRLNAYEQELKVWRSGGTVAPEDRAKLLEDSSAGGSSVIAEMEAFGKGETPPSERTGGGGDSVPDVERDAFMNRESELLDLLDEKDEEIRQLERENDALAQEKVTITKLAAESFHHQQQVKVLEHQIGDLQEDSETFELTIETLIETNVEHQSENERLKRENDAHGTSLASKSDVSKKQFAKIEAMISALTSMKPGGRQLPTTPDTASGTAVDLQIAKVRAFINTLMSEKTVLESAHAESVASNPKQQEEVNQLQQQLKAGELRRVQTEAKLMTCITEMAEADVKVTELEAANESINLKLSNAINAMIDAEMAAAEKGEVASSDQSSLISSLEVSHNDEKAKFVKDIANLRAQVATLKGRSTDAIDARNELDLKVQELEGQRDTQVARITELESKLVSIKDEQAQVTADALSSRSFKDVTNEQLQRYTETKSSFATMVAARMKKIQGPTGPSSPVKVKPMEKMVIEMQKATEIAAKHHDEVGLLKRQLTAKEERVKTLQGLYASSNESLAKKTSELTNYMKRQYSERNARAAAPARRGSIEKKTMKGGIVGRKPSSIKGGGVRGGGIKGGGVVGGGGGGGIKGGGNVQAPPAVTDADLEAEVFV
jgi:kinesin family protein 5